MEECFKCNAPETRALLFDAVLPEGVKKICGKCSASESIPIVNDRFAPQKQKTPSVYERMKKISGISPEKRDDSERKETEKVLSQMVDSNFERGFRDDVNLKKSLVDNFHWVILRGRRAKHLTQEQLAYNIKEPIRAIQLIEKGLVPERNEILNKIENYLGIKIIKKQENTIPEKTDEEFIVEKIRDLTIADLQEMKRKKELEIIEDEDSTKTSNSNM